MAVRSDAAPPTLLSRSLAEPKIDDTASVHSFSNIVGDVRIGANVSIAPGTSIRADGGSPFHIGQSTHMKDGVVIRGLEQGRVMGDDDNSYSVWIGHHTSIAHMALIHGPAYVGDHCFIGFRSTVFNARVGDGCIVMMHVLIQDVEVPPGKLVPSGTIITSQEQADRLPDAQERDRQFAAHVIGINEASQLQSKLPSESGYHCAETAACLSPIREMNSDTQQTTAYSSATNGSTMNGEIINHVRQLLAQGYRIGTEHADQRQFRTSSWKSCAPIQASNESAVLAELQSCLAEHGGEYVRLIGIDTKAKRRVLETIIQRPGEAPAQVSSNGASSYSSRSNSSYSTPSNNPPLYTPPKGQASGGLDPAIAAQVRQVLAKGGRIGMEHADERRFQTSSWKSCTPISATNESAVIAGLQACMAEHAGEYVRLIGIDPKAKRRILEAIIQRPGNKQVVQHTKASSSDVSYGGHSGGHSGAALSGGIAEQVSQLIAQGATIGVEYADERRFKTSSWYSAPAIHASSASQAMNALNSFLAEHQKEYVRLVGIDPKAKKRVVETIIQRPGKPAATSSNEPSSSYRTPASSNGHGAASNGSGRLSADVVGQIRQFVNQGYRIGLEYADQRRYKTSSWQTAASVQTNRDSDAIAKIESALAQYPGSYVRIIGIDPNAKRRVAEVLIQQPGK